ncbi:MAG: hypothetical protein A3E83_00220 [Gammaproteobacteria bacterium RIFCSPHIGHO2_12_FULL_41_20]|nr:MAG: hypothetical protein A3E83_00220 [Gammaproteobacteria bacterium RIFCSPHIGHO2_12_FULL_41_20]
MNRLPTSSYDIIIVGAGIVGATLACALAQTTSLRIALIDAKAITPASWPEDSYDYRVSAISLASQRIFQALQVWPNIIAKRIGPFTTMYVWNDTTNDTIQFASADISEPCLGHIIENSAIHASLVKQVSQHSQIELLSPVNLATIQETPEYIDLHTIDAHILRTKLLIAADGARSWVRKQIGIETQSSQDQQTAIVTTVQTEYPHQHTAWQRFLPTGPLAFLPLADQQHCSIVWSLPTIPDAQRILSLDDSTFAQQLGNAFALRLGKILSVEKRFAFPLQRHLAKTYIKPRIALIGDAAHTIHPLAGQGVNLGLLDASALYDVLDNALKNNRDFASFATLRRYERWRKGDNLLMFKAMEWFNTLFRSQNPMLKTIRQRGITLANEISWLKNSFMRHAMGLQKDLPSLARPKVHGIL